MTLIDTIFRCDDTHSPFLIMCKKKNYDYITAGCQNFIGYFLFLKIKIVANCYHLTQILIEQSICHPAHGILKSSWLKTSKPHIYKEI